MTISISDETEYGGTDKGRKSGGKSEVVIRSNRYK